MPQPALEALLVNTGLTNAKIELAKGVPNPYYAYPKELETPLPTEGEFIFVNSEAKNEIVYAHFSELFHLIKENFLVPEKNIRHI